MGKHIALYEKNHVNKGYENLELFKRINTEYSIGHVFYPGAYAHIAPAFVFPNVIFNDTYKKLFPYYESEEIKEYINKRKQYPQEAQYSYIPQDYRKPFALEDESFDLMISQYAGFISRACVKYLKIGGILLANNSHGDAGMAHLLSEYKFIAVMNSTKNSYTHSTKNLDTYFIPKQAKYKNIEITEKLLEDLGKGIGYTKYVSNYVFSRIK